jgi:hypothetical protein
VAISPNTTTQLTGPVASSCLDPENGLCLCSPRVRAESSIARANTSILQESSHKPNSKRSFWSRKVHGIQLHTPPLEVPSRYSAIGCNAVGPLSL